MAELSGTSLASIIVSASLFVVGVSASFAADQEAPVDPEAYKMMVEAVNARAVWDQDFPGFTADIEINYEGRVHHGRVQVSSKGEVQLTELSAPDTRAQSWAEGWLGEMVFHRMGTQESDDRYREIRMIGQENHPLGPLLVMNDSFNSSFRVDGKVIRQVNRDLGGEVQDSGEPKRVRINVLETAFTPSGKVLPLHFVIHYLNDDEELVAVETLSSRFLRLKQYELPQWRRVITTEDGNMTTAEMTLSRHRLGQGKEAATGRASIR
jgi:hypothetical protein